MKNDPKASHRWQNPSPGPGLSIADQLLEKVPEEGQGLLQKLAREVRAEREERARPVVYVPVQPAKPKREWLPEAEYREKMRQIANVKQGSRDGGRKPWQRRRN